MDRDLSVPWPGSEAAALDAAKADFNAGRHVSAASLFAQVLQRNPNQVHALIFLGVVRLAAGDTEAAEPLFKRCLDLDPDGQFAFLALQNLGRIAQRHGDDLSALEFFEQCMARKSDFVPVLNDFGVSLQRLGHNKEAIAAFERALSLDPAHLMARDNLGRVLADVGRVDEAIEAFRACLALAPDSAEIWTLLGAACLKVEDFTDAEKALRRVLTLDPESHDARLYLAEALDRMHRLQEADQMCKDWAQRQGVLVTPARVARPEARVLLLGGAAMCNTPTRFLFPPDRFTTITVNLLPSEDGELDPAMRVDGLPPCDVVFNAIADADRGAPFIEKAAALCRGIGRPVINPPARISSTRRDRLPSLLADIPGLIVPGTRRADRAALQASADASDTFPAPVLIRPVGSHGGNDLRRVGDGAALGNYLQAMPFDDFYVTDYCEYRSADGYYRKYRFIFIDREVYPYHLAISKNWMIHYWRADMSEEDLKREEAAYLSDYHSIFPGAMAETVRHVARRLDLDYGGMDCGVTGDGRVLVFEANANMLVHLDDSREDFAYKHTHVPKIAAAMSRLVAKRLSV